METKVQLNKGKINLPAGITEGIELFAKETTSRQMYALYKGSVYPFEQLPYEVRRPFYDAALADKEGRKAIRKMGLKGFSEEFRQWLWCKFGGLDATPDLQGEEVVPDSFNSLCDDYQCAFRGKVCKVPAGLKTHEVLTLVYVVNGYSMPEMAQKLCIELPSVKSRIKQLKVKMNARNMAQLSAKATQMGIALINKVPA